MKTGKVELGLEQTLKNLYTGKALLVLIASNCAPLNRSHIEYYAMLSKTKVQHYAGSFYKTAMSYQTSVKNLAY